MPSPRSLNARLLGWFLVAAALVALGLYGGYRNLRAMAESSLEDSVDRRIDDVRRELVTVHGLYLDRVQDSMRVMQSEALALGAPSAGAPVHVGDRTVPDLRFGGESVAMRFTIVDKITALMGGTATFFTRAGDDFVRISTDVRNADGSRAVGTILDPRGPAIAAIRQGHPFYGVVDILGRSYLTGYEPIRSGNGAVVGIYFVGYPVETLQQIGDQLAQSHLLQRGFFALLDQHDAPIFASTGADPKVIQSAIPHVASGETTWDDSGWSWRAERFDAWHLTLLAATNRGDIADQTWRRVAPVFGYMVPFMVGALALGFVFARRLSIALAQAERLREEGRKLSLVASRTYNGVIITNAAGRIEWTNAAFSRITGYSAEEVIGKAPDALLSGPDTAATARADQARARREVRGFQLEVLNYRKDGTPFWALVDGQPVLDANGSVLNFLVVQVDITKRKQAEEELLVAREAAEQANRTKSAFLANMSHELRTPMNAIIGYSEMLVEEAEDLGQESFIPDLNKIHSAGKHLLGLINDVLDLSKIEAGKMTLYLEDFAISTMIGEVAATMQPLVEKNSNKLVVESPPDFGTMHADVTKVRQTLFNLLSNAAKFTHNGRITLTVARERKDGVAHVAFRVSDTGIGMTPQQLGKLFNAFVQADASTTRKYGGTGLGLVISRKFCQLMGGDITVTSEEGKGTVFTALLPLHVLDPAAGTQSHPAASSQTASPPKSDASAPDHGNGPLILAVDDDPAVLDLLSRTLVRDGYSVRTAATGAEALTLARELRPKLITLDVMMPSMDGWSVLTALKDDPVTRAIPVVMISMVDEKQLGFALGAADYLTKPIDRGRLAEVLTKHAPRDVDRLALVIDDLPDNRAILRHALELEGWLVAEAENGRAGLGVFAAQKPSLILLDLMMPVMDGFEFLRELRAREDGRDVPVVVVTAKELTPDERETLRACVENVVQKGTVSHDNLLADIRAKIARAAHISEPGP
jgi:PAS domain S-box-containing protein